MNEAYHSTSLIHHTSPACQHFLLPAVQVSSYLLLQQPVKETQKKVSVSDFIYFFPKPQDTQCVIVSLRGKKKGVGGRGEKKKKSNSNTFQKVKRKGTERYFSFSADVFLITEC